MSLYQSINILSEYLEFRVIKVSEHSDDTSDKVLAPAITFCLGDFFSYNVVQQLFPNSGQQFEQIDRLMNSTNDSTVNFRESLRMERLIKQYQIKAINEMSVHKAFNRSARMFDYIENCLVVRHDSEQVCHFLNYTVRYIQESQICSTMLYERQLSLPSMTLSWELAFGDLIVFIFSREKMPGLLISEKFGLNLNLKMKISSQYSAPDTHDDFIELANGYHFMFKYSLVETELVTTPHTHNCQEYNQDKGGPRSREECLVYCIRSQYNNMNNTCVPPELQIRWETEDKYIKICDDHNLDDMHQHLTVTRNYCRQRCLRECIEYNIDYSYVKYIINSKNKDNYLIVSITPRKQMKIRYRLVAATALQQVLADLGGIWGIWLGFNMLNFYNNFYKFVSNKLSEH